MPSGAIDIISQVVLSSKWFRSKTPFRNLWVSAMVAQFDLLFVPIRPFFFFLAIFPPPSLPPSPRGKILLLLNWRWNIESVLCCVKGDCGNSISRLSVDTAGMKYGPQDRSSLWQTAFCLLLILHYIKLSLVRPCVFYLCCAFANEIL